MYLIIVATSCVVLLLLGFGWINIRTNIQQKNQLLVDLGLLQTAVSKNNAPFYKWGWRKNSEERVWAERIVRSAFKKAGIWLSVDDLNYFEGLCNQSQAGKKINRENAIKRVEDIRKRTEIFTDWVSRYVKNILDDILKTTEAGALQHLKESGIQCEPNRALLRYSNMILRKKLAQAGNFILGRSGDGMKLEDKENQQVYVLSGFEGWEHWVNLYTQEIRKQLNSRAANNKLASVLKNSLIQGLFQDYEEDIKDYRKFLDKMVNKDANHGFAYPREKVEELENILYHWQFSDGISFNIVDHKNIRALLTRADLIPQFRERIARGITPQVHSLKPLIQSYPRHILFYGKHEKPRRFTSLQYLLHMELLTRNLGSPAGEETKPPILLTLIDAEVKEAYDHETPVTDLIEKQKKFSIFERDIDPGSAEKQGWIINLSAGDAMVHDFSELNDPPYNQYSRFCTDTGMGIDYESLSHNAVQQRNAFLAMMFDSLTSLPPIDSQNPFEELEVED